MAIKRKSIPMNANDNDDFVEVTGTMIRETEKAILLEANYEKTWIPKSQTNWDDVKDSMLEGEEISINVKRWFAEKEGLDAN